MDLQSLANLITLRRYLHDVQNGYAVLPKEQLKGINAKLRELDALIVKNALTATVTTTVTHSVTSSEADFEASTKLVVESRKAKVEVSQAGVEISSSEGVTVANAPEEKVEKTEEAKAAPAPKKRKGAFSRTDSDE